MAGILSLPLSDTILSISEIDDIDKTITSSSSGGNRQNVNYTVVAQLAREKKLTLAASLNSASQADAVVR